MINKANLVSKAQSGTTTYLADTRRNYLFVVAVTETTCAVGGGDAFTIPAGGHWAPHICPTNEIVLVGSCVVTTDAAQV